MGLLSATQDASLHRLVEELVGFLRITMIQAFSVMNVITKSGRLVDFPAQGMTKSLLCQIVPHRVDNLFPVRKELRQLFVAWIFELGKMSDRVDHFTAAAGTEAQMDQPQHLPTRDNIVVCKGLALKA
jgi:hypothetical protein